MFNNGFNVGAPLGAPWLSESKPFVREVSHLRPPNKRMPYMRPESRVVRMRPEDRSIR